MTQYTHTRWDQARTRDDVIVLLTSSCARRSSNQFCPISQSLGHQIHSNRWSITVVYLSTCVPKITCVFTVHVYLKWPKPINFQLSKAKKTCVQWCDLPPSPNWNQWLHILYTVKKRVIVDACRLHYKSIGCPTLNHLVLSVSWSRAAWSKQDVAMCRMNANKHISFFWESHTLEILISILKLHHMFDS